MNVAELMATSVVTVSQDTKVHEIATLMREFGVSATPVTDAAGRVVGVVCSSDLLLKLGAPAGSNGLQPNGTRRSRDDLQKTTGVTAAGLMTSPAVTVTPQTSVDEATRLMRKHRVKRLPVTGSAGQLVGLVSRNDLLRVNTRTDAEILDGAARELAGELAHNPVDISVHDGIVVLAGRVRHRSTVIALLRATRNVEGVFRVENRLTYERADDIPDAQARHADRAPTIRPRDGQRPRQFGRVPEVNAATPARKSSLP